NDLSEICYFFFLVPNGGSSLLDASPKPIRTLSFLQYPLRVTVSPSSINLRSEPSFNTIGCSPLQVSSSIDPYESLVEPDMVPLPIISPLLTLHPFTV